MVTVASRQPGKRWLSYCSFSPRSVWFCIWCQLLPPGSQQSSLPDSLAQIQTPTQMISSRPSRTNSRRKRRLTTAEGKCAPRTATPERPGLAGVYLSRGQRPGQSPAEVPGSPAPDCFCGSVWEAGDGLALHGWVRLQQLPGPFFFSFFSSPPHCSPVRASAPVLGGTAVSPLCRTAARHTHTHTHTPSTHIYSVRFRFN